jgi:hypothetical protein
MNKLFSLLGLMAALTVSAVAAQAADCCKPGAECCKPKASCCKK